MTLRLFGHGEERRRRYHHPSPHKPSKSEPIAQNNYASQSNVFPQQQQLSPPRPVAPPVTIPHWPPPQPHHPAYHSYGNSLSPPQRPVYGSNPQYTPQHAHSYGPPIQHHANNSTTSFGGSPPRVGKERKGGPLDSYFNKVDQLAAKSYADLRGQLASGGRSTANLASKTTQCLDQSANLIGKKSTAALSQGAALCDLISSKLDAVITSIDGEGFSGKEQDLVVYDNTWHQPSSSTSPPLPDTAKGFGGTAIYGINDKGERGSNHFSKVWLYSNSRLPPHLPPFKVYMPTYPLLCLAANYSERVYTPPAPKTSEVETHVPSDWRSGTKAMVLKTVPIDDMHTVVFAIRGSATFMDWAVNYRSDPSSPAGFLDDDGNLCHAGFLYVAKKMIKSVADRLRALLQENPSRSHCSLLITGHSAGGAVAALIYAHMMSTTVSSDLNYLTGFFKRVHCITFGAPPVSLLPLTKTTDKRHRKSLFYSFINEGDPVPRADKQVVRSLLKLYASPAPTSSLTACSTLASLSKLNLSSNATLPTMSSSSPSAPSQQQSTTFSKPTSHKYLRPSKHKPSKSSLTPSTASTQPSWNVPPTTLSVAGRLVVLRKRPGGRDEDDVEAVTVEEEMLRTVVYGDPLKHMMSVYKRRVDGLAVRAVTAGGY